MSRGRVVATAAAVVLLAACAELNKLPGGSYLQERGKANAQKIADNAVDTVASGDITKTAAFSMEQEFYIGKTIAANVIARLGGRALPPEHPAARYVRDVGTVVALSSAEDQTADDRPYPLRGYRFVVVEARQLNAVGMPGGFVAITTGALETVRSEDELAAVLAHEIAHVQHGHAMAPLESARQQEHITSSMLAGTDALVHQFFGKVVETGTNFVLDKGYGKVNELAADADAKRTIERAGYDPDALARLLSRLGGKAAEGGFMYRHPPVAERRKALGAASPLVARTGPNPRAARFEARLSTVR